MAQSVEHVLGKDKYPVLRATVKSLKNNLIDPLLLWLSR